mgnify:CR=1 FL=1
MYSSVRASVCCSSYMLSIRSSGRLFFFFQGEDGIGYLVRSRGLGDVYKRQGVDHADAAVLEADDRTRTIFDRVIGHVTVEHVVLQAVNRRRLAHHVAHQVEQVNDLLHQLAAGLVAITPPRRVQLVAEVAGAHQAHRTGLALSLIHI